MRTSLSLITCEIKSLWIKIGLHYLMLYSYIMCSDPSVNVLVLFFLVFTFWGIKFIILKLKLEINAWFFFSFFKKLVWILSLNFWNLKDLSFDFGIQSIYLKRVGSKKNSIFNTLFSISLQILHHFGIKYKIFKNISCNEFCLLNKMHLHFSSYKV